MANKREERTQKEVDRFTQLMFGSRKKREEPKKEAVQQDADWGQLLNQVQDIISSVNNLKPVLKELSPFLDFFQKKKK